jgi:hypothetical protein
MSRLRIPALFKMFSSTIYVVFDNKKLSDLSVLGECCLADGVITMCDEYKGEPLTLDCILDTFYHEKVHMILDAMGEKKLSKNEKFVEVFARLLRQTDETEEYLTDIPKNQTSKNENKV